MNIATLVVFLAASKWCHTFRLKNSGSVKECVRKFDSYLRSSPKLLGDLPGLVSKRLVCHCSSDAIRHGHALIAVADEFVLGGDFAEATLLVGVFHDPVAFTRVALAVKHPFEQMLASQCLRAGLLFRMSSSVDCVVSKRRSVIARWSQQALRLREDERGIHATRHPEVEGTVGSQALLLFRDMLREIDYPSTNDLVHHMCSGFPLAGAVPARREVFTQQCVMRISRSRICGSVAAARSVGQLSRLAGVAAMSSLTRTCMRATMKEAHNAAGCSDFLTTATCPSWVCGCPVGDLAWRQKQKLRPIDDYSASGVNAALSACETIDPADVDHIVADCRLHADSLVGRPECRSETSVFAGKSRHPDLDGSRLLRQLWDMSNRTSTWPCDHLKPRWRSSSCGIRTRRNHGHLDR